MHFVNSGAEAVDLAVLIARASTRNFEMLALRDAYHGMHYGAMTATGIGQARQLVPPAPGYVQVMAPHPYRGPFGADAAPYLEELEPHAAHQHLRRRRRPHRRAHPGLRRHRRDARRAGCAAPPSRCAPPAAC